MNWTPHGDSVIIEMNKRAKQTKSGLTLPEYTENDLPTGVVLAIGTGAYNQVGNKNPIDLKVGQEVVVNLVQTMMNPIQQLKDDGKDYVMVKATAILAFREKE